MVSEFFSDSSQCVQSPSRLGLETVTFNVYILIITCASRTTECPVHIEWVNMEYIPIYLESVSQNIPTLFHCTNSWNINPNTFLS